jgi:ATP-binding cassette, subfamily C (CFTR/MRP), member 4
MDFCFTFSSGLRLIALAHKRPTNIRDCNDIHKAAKAQHVVDEYRAMMDMLDAEERSEEHPRAPHAAQHDLRDPVRRNTKRMSLILMLLRINRRCLFPAAFIVLIRLIGMYLQVFSLWMLLKWATGDPWVDNRDFHILFAFLLGLGAYLQSLGQHNIFHEMYHAGVRARSLMCALSFEKLLLQTPLHSSNKSAKKDGTPGAISTASSGQLMNLVATDAQALVEGFLVSMFLFSAPFEMLGALGWCYMFSGWAFAVSLAFLLAMLPLQMWLGRKVGELRDRGFAFNDRRMRAVIEFLGGINVVKLCSWESNVEELIRKLRDAEAVHVRFGNALKLFNLTFFFTVPGMLSLLHFGVKMSYDTAMPVVDTFVTIALLQMCARTFQMIPRATTSIANAMSAIRRFESYLTVDLVSDLAIVETTDITAAAAAASTSPSVEVRGTFGWHGFMLHDVALTARAGSLTVVVGPVGSGKSTLLHTLLGNCAFGRDAASGAALPYVLRRPASVAYVSQEAWIRDGTVRDNIVFGRDFDEARYRDVLYACSLEDDLLQWGGDHVEVGEKGVTLSGGQKQRLSMARACYADAELYLLDDPISAVDAKVALHLLEVCLKGYLREKTVILATHHPAPPRFADQLLVLGRGQQEALGSPQAVMAALSPTLRDELVDEEAMPDALLPAAAHGAAFQRVPRPDVDALMGQGRQLVFMEESAIGSVSGSVYAKYLKSSGAVGVIFIVFLFGGQALRNLGEWWFTAWTRNRYDMAPRDYVLIEFAFVTGMVVVGITRAMMYGVMMTNNNTAVHSTMVQHVLRSPMYFFESTPLGRIANRFGKDLDNADDMLIRMSFDFLQLIIVAVGAVTLLIYSVNWFGLVLGVFLVIFGLLFRFYIPSSRYLKRIESTSRSPSIQIFQTTLAGLPVVKVFGLQDSLRHAFLESLDDTSRAVVTSDSCQRWVGVRMDWMTVVWAIAVALFVTFMRDTVGPSISGLALSQSLMLTGILQYSVRMAADTESYMTSVERIVEYGALEQEVDAGTLAPSAAEWPTKGAVEVRGLTVAYPSNPGELALQDVSFTIRAGEKVAVVGRTGAGKSTLLATFFRMVAIPAGSIVIDGVATTELELGLLRSRMGVIPQAPTLFQGTLRYNLDPFGRHGEAEMLEALRKVQLDELVAARGLDSDVGEAGASMSVGQKQLLCAARALLANPRILFMDEATANVDEATDAAIQRVIREECRNVTVVTIAHRLQTIMDYDQVLVLARGRLVESGRPLELAARDVHDDANVFAQMCAAMGSA